MGLGTLIFTLSRHPFTGFLQIKQLDTSNVDQQSSLNLLIDHGVP